MTDSAHPSPIACHECDLLQLLPTIPPGGSACCPRCGAVLHRHKRDSLDRTLALSLAALILFVVANTLPFLAFEIQGQTTRTLLITGVIDLWRQDMPALSVLVLLTTIVVPGTQLSLLLYLLLPLRLGRTPLLLAPALRLYQTLAPWAMMEVFLLGILVSVVKLAGMATVIPGLALGAFGVLIIVLSGASACFDPHLLWERVRWHPSNH